MSSAGGSVARVKHGHCSRTRGVSATYASWLGMIQRCTNPNRRCFRNYGGRGVRVHEPWLRFESFLADMGPRPKGTTLDRWPDVDGNYEPGNCRWATAIEQQNNKRNNRRLTCDGVTLTMSEWGRRTGLTVQTISDRLRRGWSAERALGTPPHHRILTHEGRSLSLSEWARRTGLSVKTLAIRLDRGWSVERALSQPSAHKHVAVVIEIRALSAVREAS